MKLRALLKKIIRGFRKLRRPQVAYWQGRFDRYGAHAVLDLRHATVDIDSISGRQKDQIFPYLKAHLSGQEEIALDFGCGPGRFSVALAELIGGRTIAVDPIQGFLDIAPPSKLVSYHCLGGTTLPIADASIDLLWICLVLGGIPNKKLPGTIAELRRVLKPNALICLIENTTDLPSNKYWNYRPVSFYQDLFSFSALQHHSDYEDLKETNSILIGRNEK